MTTIKPARPAAAPDAVLFDLDGTLIDSHPLHVQAWQQAFADHGHSIDADRIHDQIGQGGDRLVPALLPQADAAERQAIVDRHGAIFARDCLDRARPFAGASLLLARLHADGARIVLASSASRAELDHHVAALGVADIVAATTGLADGDRSNPAPDIFAAALARAGVAAGRAIVVGDTVWDAEAARRSGLRTIGLLSGGAEPEALERAGAIAIYRHVGALHAHYDRSPLVAGG